MSIRLLREQFASNTLRFSIQPEFFPKNSHEDELMLSARRYYLLLPIAAAELEWSTVPKPKRRKIIREHLHSVCTTVSMSDIKEVDLWLSSMNSSREQLLQFGRQLQLKYGRLCFICGKQINDDLTVDHIFPHSRGGSTDIDNLILAHRKCNSAKGKSLPGEMLKWAPENMFCTLEDVETRLRYLVFLRDEFACQNEKCTNSLFTGHEIQIIRKRNTGIACYDNLETRCTDCATKAVNNQTYE